MAQEIDDRLEAREAFSDFDLEREIEEYVKGEEDLLIDPEVRELRNLDPEPSQLG